MISRRKALIIFPLAVLSIGLALGAMSIRPFTRLWKPWMLFSQWRITHFPPEPDLECQRDLVRAGVDFKSGMAGFPQRYQTYGCVVDTPVFMQRLGLELTNAVYPGEKRITLVSCVMAQRLKTFIDQALIPDAEKIFGKRPKVFLHKGGYSCRGQREVTELKSDHAFGLAIDFAGIEFDDGATVIVERDFSSQGPAGQFLRLMAEKGCAFFGSSLGPGFDELHRDHLHWSIGFPGMCVY